MTASEVFIQRLAAALVRELLTDPDDLQLFVDWLTLYRTEPRRDGHAETSR